ncbi:MAG: methylase, partial [Schwartzia sp.]|nr:methylase [Schwartzia sp. (in: firmicutes)]
ASPKAATRKKAETPSLFDEVRPSPSDYIAVPKVSSEQRRYIPIGYLSADTIAGDNLFYIPNVSTYHLGVLLSNVHNAWVRTVCGRLKSDYRYSNSVVYNNFPWPTPTDEQRAKIEQTAQSILDARALFPDASLADLYDETVMPPEFRRAHQENDKAVMQAYGFDSKTMTETQCVEELMKMYQTLTK